MCELKLSTALTTLISLFNVNVALTDQVEYYISKLREEDRITLQREYQVQLAEGNLGLNQFYEATACKAKDEDSARKFFEDIYKYAFEGGDEPDVTNYWNR